MELKTEHRGGTRKGAGRKRKAVGKAVTVSFSCSPEQKDRLRHAVLESGLRQSEYICNKLF